ncbi:MAG TPA: opacity family porin [Noviherbaspirillum sp.]|nr:opacity family porin [Noviherbaspirillum sp.]
MFRTRLAGRGAALLAAIGLFSLHGIASAENVFSVYSGSSWTRNSDLRISQPGAGTALTLQDVEWGADPLKAAPYYGLRFTHFHERYRNWGGAIDFTHYKMYGKTERVVPVQGTWKGAPTNGTGRMDQYVQRFEISHGVNVLSINGIYRWLDLGFARGRVQPYVGAGLAYYRPHSENVVDNAPHESGYQASGFGFQVLGGAHYRFTDRIGAFVEAKFNRGTAEVGIANGEAETRVRTFHAVAGLSYSF